MINRINQAAMIATIVFGAAGWFAPRATIELLDLATVNSTLGLSEIRAANGALFVGIAAAALFINRPLAFAMVGFMYLGAAVGRLTSIFLDGSGQTISYSFLAAEIIFAAWLIWANYARKDYALSGA